MTAIDINTRHIVIIYYWIRHTSHFLLYLGPILSHETLNRVNCTFRVCNSLTLCRITDFTFTTIYKCNY